MSGEGFYELLEILEEAQEELIAPSDELTEDEKYFRNRIIEIMEDILEEVKINNY